MRGRRSCSGGRRAGEIGCFAAHGQVRVAVERHPKESGTAALGAHDENRTAYLLGPDRGFGGRHLRESDGRTLRDALGPACAKVEREKSHRWIQKLPERSIACEQFYPNDDDVGRVLSPLPPFGCRAANQADGISGSLFTASNSGKVIQAA